MEEACESHMLRFLREIHSSENRTGPAGSTGSTGNRSPHRSGFHVQNRWGQKSVKPVKEPVEPRGNLWNFCSASNSDINSVSRMFDNDKLGGRKIDQSPEFGEDQLNMSLAIIASIPCVSGAVHKAEWDVYWIMSPLDVIDFVKDK
ncbi:hypothetical protein PHJA_000660100 [Phtheirospermum japonicum]|uniref:Uncharacterized protein n=1 Tax=Phtheirospermum japonicum TaxID=374723 RepID=A0A830BLQ1_9LAMI|nr:hypothetical protein PHJA_000660100 [Phtheirospermum japonicum]